MLVPFIGLLNNSIDTPDVDNVRNSET